MPSEFGDDGQLNVLQIKETETKVLGLVGLEWLADQKRQGALGHLYALVLLSNLRGLHGYCGVFMSAVQGPWDIIFCSDLTSNSQGLL